MIESPFHHIHFNTLSYCLLPSFSMPFPRINKDLMFVKVALQAYLFLLSLFSSGLTEEACLLQMEDKIQQEVMAEEGLST